MPEDHGPNAIISSGGLRFSAWLSRVGVRHFALPPFDAGLLDRNNAVFDVSILRGESSELRLAERLAGFLAEYFSSRRPGPAPPLDPEDPGGFQVAVLSATSRIPWGEMRWYGWVAAEAGKPGAARAAGGALKRNPLPLLVPCHRVIYRNGRPGGFGAGPAWKAWLLAHERTGGGG